MPDDPLDTFRTPANCLDFLDVAGSQAQFRELWSARLNGWINGEVGANFYNPLNTPTGDADRVKVEWSAFPKTVEDSNAGMDDKFRRADQRDRQGEYCEWIVEREAGTDRILKVTFTTELVEYWQAMWDFRPARVVELYRDLVDPRVQQADLETASGDYNPRNRWNTGGAGGTGAVHMIHRAPDNSLVAAVGLVGQASNGADTVPSVGGGFHADPLIILSTVRVVRRLRARLSFTDPVGVYLQEPEFHRIALPSRAPRDAKAEDFWKVTRGSRAEGCALRAEFSVPAGLGFTVADLEIDGRPVSWGSQVARLLKSATYVTPIPR